MAIRVFTNIEQQGEPIEVHETTKSMTVLAWLNANVDGFCIDKPHHMSVFVNKDYVAPELWRAAVFKPDDDVVIAVDPKGIGAIILAAVSAVIAVAAFIMIRNMRVPEQHQGSRKTLGDADIKANVPRMGDVVPEVIGSPIRYPDYLVPPRKWFDRPDSQLMETLLCIGVGEYDVSIDDVMIGDTRATAMGADFACDFFPPDTDLSGIEAWEWWHTPKEVGFTSTGGGGLDLGYSDETIPEWEATEFTVSGKDVYGNAPLPHNWRNGTGLRITISVPMQFIDGWIACDYVDNLAINVGEDIQIVGPLNNGVWRVLDKQPKDENDPDQGYYYFLSGDLENGDIIQGVGRVEFMFEITGVGDDYVRVIPSGLSDWGGFPSNAQDIWLMLAHFEVNTGWQGWFTATPQGEESDAIEIDFLFPQGLGRFNHEGALREYGAGIDYEWRYLGSSEIHTTSETISGMTLDPMGVTRRIILPERGRVQVRVRQRPAQMGQNYMDKIQWSGLKSRITGAPRSYAGVTVMSMRMKCGTSIGIGAEDKISVRARRIFPDIEDPTIKGPTRDIAPFLLYMFNQIGYDNSLINMPQLVDLHRIWNLRRDTFDTVLSNPSTVKTIANHALMAGFAELTIRDGKISFARDVRRTGLPRRIYSPQQYTAPLVESTTLNQLDEMDGIDAEYLDYETGVNAIIAYRLPEDKGERVKKVTLVGITNDRKARQIAARLRRMEAYRRTTYTGQTEMQALNSGYMDYIGLQDGVPEYGQSAFVLSVSGNTLTLSEPIDSGTEIAIFVRPDGTSTDAVNVNNVSGHNVTFSTLPITPVLLGGATDPTVVYLGKQTRIMAEALMQSIDPKNDSTTGFTAVNYDERVYADDEADPLPTAWLEGMGELALWLDAYEAGMMVISCGGVAEMMDKSQAGNDAYQNDARMRPPVSSDIFTPRALRFTWAREVIL